MTPSSPLGPAVRFFVGAIVLLGLVGGSLIVAHSGYATSPRRGGPSTFVPAPQAYLLAAILYAMAYVALLALLRDRRAGPRALVLGTVGFAAVGFAFVAGLAPR